MKFTLQSVSKALIYAIALNELGRYLFLSSPLRALGLLLADGAPTVRWGKTFCHVGRFPCVVHTLTMYNAEEPMNGRTDMAIPFSNIYLHTAMIYLTIECQ